MRTSILTFFLAATLYGNTQSPLFEARFTDSTTANVSQSDTDPVRGTAGISSPEGVHPNTPALSVGAEGDPSSYLPLCYRMENNIDFDKGTIEMWYRPNLASTDAQEDQIAYLFNIASDMLSESGSGDKKQISLFMRRNRDGQVTINWITGKEGPEGVVSSPPLSWSQEEWHHIAITWGGNEKAVLFVDGVEAASKPCTGGLFEDNTSERNLVAEYFSVGGREGTNITRSADGFIKDFRIWNSVRYHDAFEPH